VTRLRKNEAHKREISHLSDDPLVLYRSSSVHGLAQFVLRIISEYELDLTEDSTPKVAMAEERRIQKRTLVNKYVKPSGSLVKDLLKWLAPHGAPSSFTHSEDIPDSTPWALVIILIVFLGKIISLYLSVQQQAQ